MKTGMNLIGNNFWGNISRRATLLFNILIFVNDLTDTKITYFNGQIIIQEYIIQFYISMQNIMTVNMAKTIDNLSK